MREKNASEKQNIVQIKSIDQYRGSYQKVFADTVVLPPISSISLSSPCCQGPVVLDLLLTLALVLLPPTLGAEPLPGCVPVETASLCTQQLRLVHVDPSALHLCAHPSGELRGQEVKV